MIRVLPPQVANKIAAGEVIERPASVVKELVENALDAGATRLRVEVEEGGKKLIRVTDDGSGMSPEDLALAFAAHATSKIEDAEDLFQVLTFGFRGEALASMGSVARCSIVTRRRGRETGHRVQCEGSRISPVIEAGAPEGTVVEIRDLFRDVPARRKFLKSDSAEIARITEMLTRVVLPLEDVHLELLHNGRRVLLCEAAESFERRIVRLFGRELEGKLLEVSGRGEGIELRGHVGLPETAKRSSSRQFLFLNDRAIKDRSLAHAVTRGFEGFVMDRLYPVFFVHLTLDPRLVDVNVHPAKTEVRLRDRDAVFSVVRNAVRSALQEARPTAELALEERSTAGSSASSAAPAAGPTRRERSEAFESALFPGPGPRLASPAARARETEGRGEHAAEPRPSPVLSENSGEAPSSARVAEGPARRRVSGGRFMQVHDSYILVEDEEGFAIIDQHALHERMLFETLRRRAERGEAARQRLLVPDVVHLGPADREQILSVAETLSSLGLEVAPFGEDAVAIEAVPIDLARTAPRRLLEAVLEDEGGTGRLEGLLEDRLAHRACRAAVKFSDPLSDDAVRALLEWERTSPDSAACPHGRPTRLRISLAELERRFMRKE